MRAGTRWICATLVAAFVVAPGAASARPARGALRTSGGEKVATADAGPAIVERIDWEASPSGGRIVVVVRGVVEYTTHAAAADEGAGLPPRAYVDLRPARLGPRLDRAPVTVDDGLLLRVRHGQFDPSTVRVVVDLTEPAVFEVRATERPTRLILSLRSGSGRDSEATTAVVPPPQPAAAPARAAKPEPAEVAVSRLESPGATSGALAEPAPPRDRAAVSRAEAPAKAPLAAAAGPPSGAPPPKSTPQPKLVDSPAATAASRTPAAVSPTPAAIVSTPTVARPGTPAPEVVAMAPAPPPVASPATRRDARVVAPRVVVLDPGHGGKDPGARGVTGDEEKTLTLVIAELVDERLREDEGLRVALTRTDDRSVSLEQRTAIANAQGADLFVSIHANASENPQLAGIETYTLNNTNDRATIRLAAMENGLTLAGASPGERDLAYILSDLLQTGKEDESVALADSIQRDTLRHLRSRWKGITNLGVKKGPFYVLVGAYMPCVLVEVGFLTHEVEGQRIASRRYQRDLAEGIAQGIRRFLDSAPANANL
jgi:N-acetylmuramoyl-L-alanine amidase